VDVGKALLRDYIKATVGFETLSRQINKPSKSLHRMLSPSGNPGAHNFFEILSCLQNNEGLELVVSARHRSDTDMASSASGV